MNVYLFVRLNVHLNIYLFKYLFVYLFICLNKHLCFCVIVHLLVYTNTQMHKTTK